MPSRIEPLIGFIAWRVGATLCHGLCGFSPLDGELPWGLADVAAKAAHRRLETPYKEVSPPTVSTMALSYIRCLFVRPEHLLGYPIAPLFGEKCWVLIRRFNAVSSPHRAMWSRERNQQHRFPFRLLDMQLQFPAPWKTASPTQQQIELPAARSLLIPQPEL